MGQAAKIKRKKGVAKTLPPYGAHKDDTPGDICPLACRRMWVAVLADGWDETFHAPHKRDRDHAAQWMRSRGCRVICGMIGLDWEEVYRRWQIAHQRFEETGIPPERAKFNMSSNPGGRRVAR